MVIEAVTRFPVPVIDNGVRFRITDSGFIFWAGSRRRSARILDFCETATQRLVSRERRRAPVCGLG
jgi:hypothetical protein